MKETAEIWKREGIVHYFTTTSWIFRALQGKSVFITLEFFNVLRLHYLKIPLLYWILHECFEYCVNILNIMWLLVTVELNLQTATGVILKCTLVDAITLITTLCAPLPKVVSLTFAELKLQTLRWPFNSVDCLSLHRILQPVSATIGQITRWKLEK